MASIGPLPQRSAWIRAAVLGVGLLLLLGALGAANASAAPGDLDPTFGAGTGSVRMFPSNEEISLSAAVTQADGKIVLAGHEAAGNAMVVRLLPDGTFDPSFGLGGKAVITVPTGFSEARAVAIQPDGKIVVAGGAKGATNPDFFIARLTSGGLPDTSFGGGDGVTIVPVGAEEDEAEAVAIGPGGKIVATGEVELPVSNSAAGVVVLLPEGTPDPGFNGNGTTMIKTAAGDDGGVAAAVLGDGRILIGDSSGAGGGEGFTLVRLLSSSAPDPSFGGDGIVETPIPTGGLVGNGMGRITDLALLGDGRIVASGYGFDYTGTPPVYDPKFAAVEYLANGELDSGFGSGGIFSDQLGPGNDTARVIQVAEGGRLLLAGGHDDSSKQSAPALLRLNPTGTVDPSFGTGGQVLRDRTAPFGEILEDAAIDGEDRLLTVSTAFVGGGNTEVVVSRYLGDPRPVAANRPPHARMKKIPRKVSGAKLKGFSGTASDPDGGVLGKVQIALVKLVPQGAKASRRGKGGPAKACFVMKNAKARFKKMTPKKGQRCPQRWLAVKGKAKWSFKLKASLPAGSYVVYSRAVDSQGLAESAFSRKAGNRFAFRVLPR